MRQCAAADGRSQHARTDRLRRRDECGGGCRGASRRDAQLAERREQVRRVPVGLEQRVGDHVGERDITGRDVGEQAERERPQLGAGLGIGRQLQSGGREAAAWSWWREDGDIARGRDAFNHREREHAGQLRHVADQLREQIEAFPGLEQARGGEACERRHAAVDVCPFGICEDRAHELANDRHGSIAERCVRDRATDRVGLVRGAIRDQIAAAAGDQRVRGCGCDIGRWIAEP